MGYSELFGWMLEGKQDPSVLKKSVYFLWTKYFFPRFLVILDSSLSLTV